MGVETLTAQDPKEERAIRAALNSYVRRAELATVQAENEGLKREKVEREAREAAYQTWQSRPEYAAVMGKAQELREAYGDEVADQYLRGFNADLEQVASQEVERRMATVNAQAIERAALGWKDEAWGNVTTLPEVIRTLPDFPKWFESAVHSFDAELALGHYPEIQPGDTDQMHKKFMNFFNALLTARPEVVDVVRKMGQKDVEARTLAAAKVAEEQRRIEQIKQDAVEAYKKQVATTREAIPPHPLGNLTGASRDRVPAGSEAAAVPAAEQSPQLNRKSARAAVRDDVARHLGT
jgi:hypothetical protein